MSYLSDRVQNIKPSATIATTMKANELRAQGKDIIALSAGEPDFDTPEFVKEAAIKAIQDGKTKYTAVDGTAELKSAIIEKFKRDNHLNYQPEQIIASNGAKHVIFNLLQAIINPGDEVLVLTPYWVSYPDMIKLCDGKPVILKSDISTGYKVSAEQIKQAITPKTKLILFNLPNNPSGMVYSKEDYAAIANVLLEHPNILIMTDDIYEHILWTEEPFCNIVNVCPDLYDRTIVVNGVSKAYAMTGWRIGYAGGPVEIVKAMKKLQAQNTSNPCSISQAASTAALNGDQNCLKPMIKAFKERHDLVFKALNEMPGVNCLPGHGAFYAFPDVREVIKRLDGISNDIELSNYLLEKAGVALVPGSAFGVPDAVRLSYATSNELLTIALERIHQAIS